MPDSVSHRRTRSARAHTISPRALPRRECGAQDADALFLDLYARVEDRLVQHLPPNCSMAVVADGDGVQADQGALRWPDEASGNPLVFHLGVILARGDARGAALLRDLGERATGSERFSKASEQQAFNAMWRDHAYMRRDACVVRPRQRMQSFLKTPGEVDVSTYIVHLTMCISQRQEARNKRQCIAEVPSLLNRTEAMERSIHLSTRPVAVGRTTKRRCGYGQPSRWRPPGF